MQKEEEERQPETCVWTPTEGTTGDGKEKQDQISMIGDVKQNELHIVYNSCNI